VASESLQFCFDALVKDSGLEPLALDIEVCLAGDGVRGDELDLSYLEIEEPGDRMNRIPLERKVLSENDRIAGDLRRAFQAHGILCLNFISSPGSGRLRCWSGLWRLSRREPASPC